MSNQKFAKRLALNTAVKGGHVEYSKHGVQYDRPLLCNDPG